MARREWSDNEKSEALSVLDANNGALTLTSKQTGVPVSTLERWAKGKALNGDISQLREEKKESLADAMERVAWKCVEVLPDKLEQASAKDAATVMGIATEKMQLLREKPTQITRDDGLTDEQRAEGVAALLDRARARRAGQVSAADAAAVH